MYGEGKNWRFIIGVGVVIIMLFVIIFMIINSGRDSSGEVPETKKDLISYATNDNITITSSTIGPITAAQNHYETEISVTNSQAVINIINGYDGNVINTRAYPVTTESFREFLSAIDKAGFTNGNTDKALANDNGYCATGQRYIFEVRDGGDNIQRFWTTSCGDTKTYKGNREATLNLFVNQIPDYDEIVGDIDFGSNASFL